MTAENDQPRDGVSRERDLIASAELEASDAGRGAPKAPAGAAAMPTSAPVHGARPGHASLGAHLRMPPADSFPGYQLIREIHRGGQGIVYQAIQKTTRRKVAIKVLREGPFASEREKVRFEREVQVLAQLNHPAIVAIHDSGSTPGGQFYYVMDYISGQPLDTYVEAKPLPSRGTGTMHVAICQAINAAHLKGIIHRDLKPGNILIDAEGEPHVLDFGLAKVAGPSTTGAPQPELMSITGQFVGTPAWASPEQAEGHTEHIDVRTDVYSLGVILYHTLTGKFPYDVSGPLHLVVQEVISADPVPPRTLRKQIDDDLQTIVLKCLAKPRDRRYQSAGEIARDLERYLAGEPIEAKRDSATYVLRKYLRRYRVAAALVAAFVVLITAALVVSLSLWRDARDNEIELRRQLAINEEAGQFMSLMVSGANPNEAKNPNKRLRQLLDDTGRALDAGKFKDEPEKAAAVRELLGKNHIDLGLAQQAVPHLRTALALRERVLGPDHIRVADSHRNLGRGLLEQEAYDEAETHFQRALEIQQKSLGPGHASVIDTLSALAAIKLERGDFTRAETLYRQLLDLRLSQQPPAPIPIAETRYQLAMTLFEQRRFADAEPLFRAAMTG